VVQVLEKEAGLIPAQEIAEATDLSTRKVTTVISRLKDVGALEVRDGGEIALAMDPDEAAEAAAEAQQERKEGRRKRLEQMQRYAELTTCRREFMLRYFGDDFTGPCGNCDNDGQQSAAGTRREVVAES